MRGIMKKTTNNYRAYIYSMKLLPVNVLAILVMFLLLIITYIFKEFTLNTSNLFILSLMFMGYFLWLCLHELLHGLGYRISGAKSDNICYGMYLEKSVFVTLCKEEVSKKGILISLMMPFVIIGVFTYIIGLIIDCDYLILLSIVNLSGAAMDLVMFLYILPLNKNIRYAECDSPTKFVLISNEDLKNKKSLFFEIETIKEYKKQDYVFPKTKKVFISKSSYIFFGILLLISIITGIIYFI